MSMQEKKYDVIALGELLIDFTQNGLSGQGNLLFEANPGGAPCNVLAMLQKLGKRTAFIGKVGNDFLGELLYETVKKNGIHVDNLLFDEEVNTTLAFVHNKPDGDREFSFYRNPGADMMLTETDIREEEIRNARVFHCGTLSMTHEEARKATKKAIAAAKEHGVLFSFDPNLRPALWKLEEEAREQIMYGLQYCDILKISDDEILFVTGEKEIKRAVCRFREMTDAKLICVTMGKDGSLALHGQSEVFVPGVKVENVVDTTGAGDTFMGCILNYVLDHGLDLTDLELKEMLEFANKAASRIITRKGALNVMPEPEEIWDTEK